MTIQHSTVLYNQNNIGINIICVRLLPRFLPQRLKSILSGCYFFTPQLQSSGLLNYLGRFSILFQSPVHNSKLLMMLAYIKSMNPKRVICIKAFLYQRLSSLHIYQQLQAARRSPLLPLLHSSCSFCQTNLKLMIGGCSNKQKKALKDFLYINQKQTGGSVRTHNSIEKKALSQLYIIAVRSFKEDENWGAKKLLLL